MFLAKLLIKLQKRQKVSYFLVISEYYFLKLTSYSPFLIIIIIYIFWEIGECQIYLAPPDPPIDMLTSDNMLTPFVTTLMCSSAAPRNDSRGVLMTFFDLSLSCCDKCSVLVLVTNSTLLALNT